MFFVVGMMMIVAACGDDTNGNNTLTITMNCTKLSSKDCTLIPKHLPKHIFRINVLNFETYPGLLDLGFSAGMISTFPLTGLSADMISTFPLTDITFLEISNDKKLKWPIATILPFAFYQLPNIEELNIHLDSLTIIFKDAFHGLNALKTLNLNGCKSLMRGSLEQALKPPALPLLENLFVSGISRLIWHELISNRTLRKLDVSKSNIMIVDEYYNCEKCAHLEYLNVSASSFVLSYIDPGRYYFFIRFSYFFPEMDVTHTYIPLFFTNLTNLDMSYMNLQYPLKWFIENKHLKVVNISAVCKSYSTFKINEFQICYLRLSCTYEYFEITERCNRQSVEVLELAQNHLEFIEPKALAYFKNALTINLSGNSLFMMMKNIRDQFEILFRSLNHLEVIRLSNNELTEIPPSLFESNLKLRHIDLSSNKLQTISLNVTHLDHLEVLDLENNEIIVLDSFLFSVIDTLPEGSAVNLNSNPLDCSHCADLGFVSWLATSNKLQHKGLTCLRSNTVIFLDDAIVAVRMICEEEIKLRLSIGIPVGFLALLCIIILIFFYKRRQSRIRCRQREVKEIKMIIRKKEMFAVFLTYCSEDDEFVKQYVVDNLNQNLKRVIGTDRDLVCEGDRYFRLGKPVMDEMSELLDRSGVLVAILSNNYCQSVFCRNEFQLAIYKEIPILLMLKDTVDPENMTPSMRDMFEKKTRVLFECENGEYKLKTTWLNVCQSVVELIDIKKLRVLTKTRPVMFEGE